MTVKPINLNFSGEKRHSRTVTTNYRLGKFQVQKLSVRSLLLVRSFVPAVDSAGGTPLGWSVALQRRRYQRNDTVYTRLR